MLIMKNLYRNCIPTLGLAALSLHAGIAHGQQVINDTLTGASSVYPWQALNGACLTAGDDTGTIPSCKNLAYYSGKTQVGGTTGRLPDLAVPVASGALRLTNGDTQAGSNGNNQTGAVVSNFTFPSEKGIQVTWTSVSYGGNNYNGTGADGISFFLADGGPTSNFPPTIGALGGSLGYSCSNGNSTYDGVVGGYVGVGIDEFGNFANPGDNTDTGPGFRAGRIAVRGAGSTAWSALSATGATFAKFYTDTTKKAEAIHNTCKTGMVWNYSGGTLKDSTKANISNGSQTNDKLPYNYPLLKSIDLPSTGSGAVVLANQEAIDKPLRGSALPIIFSLRISADGFLDFSYTVNNGATQAVLTGFNIVANNGPLPVNFRFGFSAGTGGGSNVHEITCFKATEDQLSNSSAASNVQQSGRILGGEQVFLAYYHPLNWWGTVTANSLQYDAATDTLSALTTANWDASCKLTGGVCDSVTSKPTVTAQDPNTRTILSWDNNTTGAGIPLRYTNLSTSEKASLGNSSDLLDFLRGVRSKEALNGGTLRNRTSVLGDIVDSSPVFVGAPGQNYSGTWADKLWASTMPEGSSYGAFATTNATRINMVYVGANDGMLHGFSAGSFSAATPSVFDTTTNTGTEMLAYMPGRIVSSIHTAAATFDYSNAQYLHNFFVDSTPATGDLYYSGGWHTWIVSGLGVGGHPEGPQNDNSATVTAPVSALFALDVTTPTAANFIEGNAASLVKGEWTSASISCTGNATCGTNFGQTLSKPLIKRLHDGTWGVIWGNGTNSASQRAGIYILHIDPSDGSQKVQYIDAGPGPANGIDQVAAADLDGDNITDYVYAGDVLGHVWRFDLLSKTSTDWNTTVTNIFNTPTGQPISTAVLVSAIPAANATGNPKVLVSFGTGQKLPFTHAASEVYASGTQSLYGVWDANMDNWNSKSATVKYDSLASPSQQPIDVTTAITAQTVTATTTGTDGLSYRVVSKTVICWYGSTVCGSGNTQMGWKLDLPGAGEQVIYDPVQVEDTMVVNTVIPQSVQPITCGNTPAAGFTMAVGVTNGGGDNAPFTDAGVQGSGVGTSGTGTVALLLAGDKHHLGMETNKGAYKVVRYNFTGGKVDRVTWTKLR
jgi:type IV pilus assembly protein PilY1